MEKIDQQNLFRQTGSIDVHATLGALKRLRVKQVNFESEIQTKIGEVLDAAGIAFKKECRLGPRNRIDFLLEGGIGIEVKKSRPNQSALLNQITRYLAFDEVRAIIIVVQKQRDLSLPDEISGKRVALMSTNQLWGVAI